MEQNSLNQNVRRVLVCFALRQEATEFKRRVRLNPHITAVVTGMGLAATERAVRKATGARAFDEVFSCGFAAGLNPVLAPGTVLFDAETVALRERLRNAGATAGRFAPVQRFLITCAQKTELYRATGADAAEFESEAIKAVCRERNIPFAIVRVILDAAAEDLPLDFNEFMTATGGFGYAKFFWAVAREPRKVQSLVRLVKRCRFAAEKLADVLAAAICPQALCR